MRFIDDVLSERGQRLRQARLVKGAIQHQGTEQNWASWDRTGLYRAIAEEIADAANYLAELVRRHGETEGRSQLALALGLADRILEEERKA